MNGYPKEQATFARVSGYVEQFDVHSPQTTVREALLFSAQLRTRGETTEVITAFVDEVMDLVELTSLRDGLVSASASYMCPVCPIVINDFFLSTKKTHFLFSLVH